MASSIPLFLLPPAMTTNNAASDGHQMFAESALLVAKLTARHQALNSRRSSL
jgi:hypothetical protein